MSEQQHRWAEAAYAFFSHARFSWALSLSVIATIFGAHLLNALLGAIGYATVIAGEIALVVLVLLARRRSVQWNRFLPLSLLVFVAWSSASYFWSYYDSFSAEGIVAKLSLTFLALGLSAIRDTVQLIRAFGDVFRVVLSLSLILEVFSGVLIDMPIPFLDIDGNLTTGFGIQGIMAARTPLMVVALLAMITFVIEWRTHSVTRQLSFWSALGALLCFVLGVSPVGYATAAGVGIIALLLLLVRRLPAASRRGIDLAVVAVLAVGFVLAYVFRTPVVNWLSSIPVLNFRFSLWSEELRLARMKLIEGWGWVGIWPDKTPPFTVMNSGTGDFHDSGLNIFLDTWLQLGLVGLALLLIVLGVAFARSWRLAVTKRSELYVWAPLVLGTLIISGAAESIAITGWGWFLVVIVVARSSAELSWRKQTTS